MFLWLHRYQCLLWPAHIAVGEHSYSNPKLEMIVFVYVTPTLSILIKQVPQISFTITIHFHGLCTSHSPRCVTLAGLLYAASHVCQQRPQPHPTTQAFTVLFCADNWLVHILGNHQRPPATILGCHPYRGDTPLPKLVRQR